MTSQHGQKFKKLFGIKPELLGQILIISPFLSPKMFKSKLQNPDFFQGLVYKGATGTHKNKSISFIQTGVGPLLVSDCVLAQDKKQIQAIIFLGAVGAVDGLEIGENLLIKEAFFDSRFCNQVGLPESTTYNFRFEADPELVNLCQRRLKSSMNHIKKSNVISLNSLWSQDKKLALSLKQKGIASVDLECAFFYAAASYKKIKGVAFCFVSDQLIGRPYWSKFSKAEKATINNSVNFLVETAINLSALY